MSRPGGVTALGGTLLVAATVALAPAPAAARTIDECVREKVAEGMRQTQALAECTREQRGEETPATTAPAEAADTEGGTSTATVVIAALAGAAAGLALGWVLARRRAAPAPAATTAPATSASGADSDHRRLLVEGLVELRDRVSSDALRVEIGERLAQVGVREVVIEPGTVFDPAAHRGVDTRAVDDASWDGRVAETERPGYTDGGATLRPPEVVVYRHESPPAAG